MEILSRKRCIIGEGPVWNARNGKLYQVNGFANEILEVDLDTKEVITRKLDFPVAAIGFSVDGRMLISCIDGAFFLCDDNTRIPLYDREKYEILYGNDARVGPDGRFYVGTQSRRMLKLGDQNDGKLYSIDKDGTVKMLLDGLCLSNGLDWSMDGKRFYLADSGTRIISEYFFDADSGDLTPTGRQVKVPLVDGMTIDENDFLYVACWGAGHIAVVDTADMQIKDHIPVPAKAVASCGFVGESMDRLAVVTASYATEPEDVLAGFTFLHVTGTKGRAPFLFG